MALLSDRARLHRARPARLRPLGRARRRDSTSTRRATPGRRDARARDGSPAVVCGHSLGGPLAVALRLRHPDVVARVILVGPERARARAGLAAARAERVPLYRALRRAPFPLGALAGLARRAAAARRAPPLVDDPSTVDRRDCARLVDGGRDARELPGAIAASFAIGLAEEARAPGGADRGDLGRPRSHRAARPTPPSCRRTCPRRLDPLPARLRPPADGRAARGVRVRCSAALAIWRLRFRSMREPTTQDIDALIGRVDAALRLSDPRARRAAHRRRCPRIIRCGPTPTSAWRCWTQLGYANSRAEGGDPSAPLPGVSAGTLRQHAVAAEAIARGDLLFALYSGELPPSEDDQLWLLPDGNEPEAVASTWQREAAAITAHAPRRPLPRERARRLPAGRGRGRPHRRHARLVGTPPQRASRGRRAAARSRSCAPGPRRKGAPPGDERARCPPTRTSSPR